MRARNPWSRLTEARLTYAFKLLAVILLALYLGEMALAFLERIHTLVYIVVASIFFTYLIYPAVSRLRERLTLPGAIGIVYLAILALLMIVGSVFIPRVSADVSGLVQNYPQLSAQATAYLTDPANPIVSRLPPAVRSEIANAPQTVGAWIRVHGIEAAGHALTIVLGTFAAIATFVIVPLFSAYLLMDIDRLRDALQRVIPADRWRSTMSFLSDVDGVIGGFIRGQMLVAACVGVMLTIVLLVMHVKYAFLLGLVAAIGDLIPYVGAVLVFVPSVTIALLNNGPGNAIVVAILFLVVYELEGHVFGPMIVSSQVKLSPLAVLVAVLIGAELAGIVGMLVAVPVMGMLRIVLLRAVAPPPRDAAASGANPEPP